MLGIIRNFLRKNSPNLFADSISKAVGTNPFFTIKGRQETDPVNAPSAFENTRISRLGFMQGDGRVPENLNTMGAEDIKDLFLKGGRNQSRL